MKRRVGVAVVLSTMVFVACGGDDRPSTEAWRATWDAERALVPTEAEMMVGGRELCDELVGTYRERFDELTPTPSEGLDDAVGAWADHAAQIVFDCSDDPDVIADEYAELRTLETEISAGLDADA